ncbi:membrane protein [Gluconobacter japonicus]|nr:membrane protein [Gluconobacter japonicus]
MPVRICKDALEAGVPHRDLLLTPEHCLYFDERFSPVRMLVNGATIAYAHKIRSYECYHVETCNHAVIQTNGLLTESYLDTGNRRHFRPLANGTVVSAFNGPVRNWSDHATSLLCTDQEFVEPLYDRIVRRALEMGYVGSSPKTDSMQEPAFGLLLPDGTKVRPLRVATARHIFSLSPLQTAFS